MIHDINWSQPDRPALINANTGHVRTYAALRDEVQVAAAQLHQHSGRGLVFLYSSPTAAGVVAYLACQQARFPVCLLEPDAAGPGSERLRTAYQPEWICQPASAPAPDAATLLGCWPTPEFHLYASDCQNASSELHADLAVLLTTSGSTGDPKLVRLSSKNLAANARSIGESLGLTSASRAIQSLPMTYSYGLSIINSHLVAGSTVVFPRGSFMRPEFWVDFTVHAATSFAGVPFMYETLAKLRFDPRKHVTLRQMTQAGGALAPAIIELFDQRCRAADASLFVMYGQTEATARISYLPPASLPDHVGSIGVPIPGGQLSAEVVDQDETLTELVYRGANVMLGYATDRASLALGDVQQGRLRTGDLGRVDSAGHWFITGRLKRFAKLPGRRINLVDVESSVETRFDATTAAVDAGDRLKLWLQPNDPLVLNAIDPMVVQQHVSQLLAVPPKMISVEVLTSLPRTAAGKKDYQSLARAA